MAEERYKCFKCGNPQPLSSYFTSRNGVLDYLPICKSCAKDLFNKYLEECESPFDALYKFCAAMNLYYSTAAANGAFSTVIKGDGFTDAVLGNYMKTLQLPQYVGKTFLDSEGVDAENVQNNQSVQEIIDTTRNNVKKWGSGYSGEEYRRLNELYSQWAGGTPQDTVTQVSLTKDLCKIDLKIEKYTVENRDTKDLLTQKQALIKSLAIDPQTLLKNRQDNEANECFGAWIAEIEENSPAEYLDDPSVYFDVNGIEAYWDKHIRRPLKNLLTGTKDFPDIDL